MSKVWMCHIQGCYAFQVWDAQTEQEARRMVREWLKVKRLPNGTEFWENKPSWASDIARANRHAGFNAQTDF